MDFDTAAKLASDIGVAGVVLLVLLFRIGPKLDEVTRALENLTDAVQLHVVLQGRVLPRPMPPENKP